MKVIVTENSVYGVYVVKCEELDYKCYFMDCTRAEAIRKFRQETGLKYKHLDIIDLKYVGF